MLKRLLFSLVAMIVLAACGNGNTPDSDGSDSSQMAEEALLPLEVEIVTESEAFEPEQEGKIEAKVTKGDENVADADEVQFEIWKQGHEDSSEHMDAENEGEGIYALNHTFEEEGIYYVIAHVTARGSHTMPQKEFHVGDVEEDEHGEHDEHQDHGGNGVSIHLMEPDIIVVNQSDMWMVHLEKDSSPLTEADVRLEYWKTGKEKHHFIETTEGKSGEYTAEFHFEEPGEFHVKVHVEKGDLHEHKETTLQVE